MRYLTAQECKARVAKGGNQQVRAAPSLYLRVQGASAAWQFRAKFEGKSRFLGLGRFGEKTLAIASQEAAALRERVKAGENVFDSPHPAPAVASRAAGGAPAGDTFQEVAEAHIKSHRVGWKNSKHAAQWENTLKTYAFPRLGSMRCRDIKTDDVLAVLEPIWKEKHETATRVRMRIEAILDAAKARGMRNPDSSNPAAWKGHLKLLLPTISKAKRVQHHAAMPYPEVPAYVQSLSEQSSMSASALRFTILTACRTGEVIGARWGEFDLDAGLWKIPKGRIKAVREHWVPLSRQAVALLRALPRMDGSDVVFHSPKTGRAGEIRPLSNMAMLELLRDDFDGLTVHGFRSSFRDWAGETTAHPREVIEHALAHRIPDAAEAAYARGTLLDKRRLLMQDWADYLDTPQANAAEGAAGE